MSSTGSLHQSNSYRFLNGEGEMAQLTRSYDWTSSSLGPVGQWPQTLRTTVGIILHSHFPMFLWWGDDMIQFYNDGYRPSFGQTGKHPQALGQKAFDCWPEIWHIIYPLIEQVKKTGQSFFSEDQLVPIFRNGKIEDVYWTFSYSAVIGEEGNIDGVLVICNETTGRVNALRNFQETQEKLALSESNLRNIILQAPVAMCIYKGATHIVEIANDRMYTLWGKDKNSFIGKSFFEGLPEAANQGFEELLDNVYNTGETFTGYGLPVTLPRAEGIETVYVQFVYEALRDADGTISGVMTVAIDVTSHVISQNKLKESEHRLRSVIESAPFPIAIYEGREMKITLANQSIVDVWGKGPDVVGKTYYGLLPELESQDIYAKLDAVFTSGHPFNARNQLVKIVIHGELKPFYFNYSFTPLFNTEGQVTGVMNTAADVTDLHEALDQVEASERNFRAMILQSPVAMCLMTGPNHVVELANDMMIELWGKPTEAVMNKPIFEGLPDARDQGLEKLLNGVYTTGETVRANEHPVQLLRKGKLDTVFQNFVYEALHDGDGTIFGVLAITIDVTAQVLARHKIEELVDLRTAELGAANNELKKSNTALSQYAYITSHDLQEPARKINTFIEMLRRRLGDTVDERAQGFMDKIDVASKRMLTLIRDVLTFSQLSRDGAKFESVDLNQVVEDIRGDYELLIEQKECEIICGTLPTIEAIPVQMSQLIGNFFSNALKFSRDNVPLTINIQATLVSESDKKLFASLKQDVQYWELSFADNGIGFDPLHASRIFDVFQRLHAVSEYQGTGIGLAMCKKIAENHGGEIFASSSPGKGSVFTVILPTSHR